MNATVVCRLVAAIALSLAGCAAVAVDSAPQRRSVAALLAERTGTDVITDAKPGEPLVAERVRELLADGLRGDEAVRIMLLHNRELRAIYADLDIAQSDLVQASLLHNPVLDAAAGFPVGGGSVDVSLGVAMDFIDLLYVPLRKRVATASLEQAKLRVAAEVLDFVWRTQTAAYRHQADEQMLEMRRQVAQSTDASFELARRMREAGNVTELELASHAALAEESKLDLRLAELAVRETREELNTLMGLWGDEAGSWTMATSRLPDPPADALDLDRFETRAIEQSLDLAAAERSVVAAGENVGLDRASALFPELVIGGAGERDGADWMAGPGLTLALPFFDRGQARVARAEAELRRARELHHALAVRIRAAARSTRDRVITHGDRARHYRQVELPLRERVVTESALHYNAMQIGPFELLRAKEEQIETGARYVEALRDYWLARADAAILEAGRLPQHESAAAPLPQLPRFPFPTL